MASLFDLLRDTMPIAAAEYGMTWEGAKLKDLQREDADAVLRLLENDESYEAIVPELKATNPKDQSQGQAQRLWSWKHDAAEPAVVSDIWCRVRDADYISHKVLDSIEWGHEDPDTLEYKKIVRVATMTLQQIDLPLTVEFLAQKWVVMDGHIRHDQTPLWKLESRLDKGLVLAFVYELDGSGGPPTPWKPGPQDKAGLDAAKELTKRARAKREEKMKPQQGPQSPKEEPSPYVFASFMDERPEDGTEAAPRDAEPWGTRVRKGELIGRTKAETNVSGAVPSVAEAELGPARMVVVLSLSLCRERTDFEPGGFVGMARIYPHVMFIASVPVRRVEASVRLNRPERSMFRDPPDGFQGAKPTCHTDFDGSNGTISSIAIADANDSTFEKGTTSDPLNIFPFWANLFAYYLPHTFKAIGTERMRVVRTDRRWAREAEGLVVRDVEQGYSNYGSLKKEARQGEFDNIHLAPSLRVLGASAVEVEHKGWLGILGPTWKIDIQDRDAQEHLRLTNISMAPFCAHDCLHVHWRWGKDLTKMYVLGWDDTGPYKVAGAPMVPTNQDVTAWMRADAKMTYHATVGREDESVSEVPAGAWQVVMHHGAAYALAITNNVIELAGNLTGTFLADGFTFLGQEVGPDGERSGGIVNVSPRRSHAMLYWHLRYVLDYQEGVTEPKHWRDLRARERTTVNSWFEVRKL